VSESPHRLTRRGFLGSIVATGAAAVGVVEGGSAAADGASLPHLAPARSTAYRRTIGSTFFVKVKSKQHRITLVAVDDLNMANLPRHAVVGQARTTGEQFSLMFQGSGLNTFPQGTYMITSKAMSPHSLFIVPVGRRRRTQAYQAIIVSV
jgi:uncharacterized protein DUF6916